MILKQACSEEYQGAQGAFKDSMIHWILQFTLLIAFRCVLHRCESQEIRCWKLYKFYRLHKAAIDSFVYMLWSRCKDIDLKARKSRRRGTTASKNHRQSPWRYLQIYKVFTGGKIKVTGVHMLPEEPATTSQVYSVMILPQVHLRKPCYDFYFL